MAKARPRRPSRAAVHWSVAIVRSVAAVEIAPEIVDADAIVGITHFKGHEMSGFGGTLKNFGMGTASRHGKLAMHSTTSPRVKTEACTACHINNVYAGTSRDCVGCHREKYDQTTSPAHGAD